jgi:WD40 repeat protein
LDEPNHEVSLPGYTRGIRGVAFSANSKKLASGEHNGEVKFWDLSGPEPRLSATVTPHINSRVEKVLFSPDGKTLAIISHPAGRSLTLWNVEAQKSLMTVPIQMSFGVAFSPDGKIVASGGKTLRLWEVATQKELAAIDGHKGVIMAIAFSPDGKTLATASLDHTVKLWSVTIGQEVATLKGHRGPVSGLAFSHDGTLLVSSSEDKTIRLWRADSEDAFPPTVR